MTAFTDDVLYIHIPKCGGWSVKMYMARHLKNVSIPNVNTDDLPIGHVRLADVERFTGRKPEDWKQILVTIRNPYAQQVSQWQFWRDRWAKGHVHPHDDISAKYARILDWLRDPRADFHTFYDYHYGQELEEAQKWALPLAWRTYHDVDLYTYWLEVDGKIPPNICVIRIEEAEDELPAALQPYAKLPLPPFGDKRNPSPHGRALTYLQQPEARLRIEMKAEWAFEHWYKKATMEDVQAAFRAENRAKYDNPHSFTPVDQSLMVPHPAQFARDFGVVGQHDVAIRRKIGVWRWKGVHKHAEMLLELLNEAERVIDFGGAAGPLGYGSVVVDPITDIPTLHDIDGPVDLIFTSHTLEHLADVEGALAAFYAKLNDGGKVVIHVPSYRAEHLRPQHHANHKHAFKLESDDGDWLPLNLLVDEAGFTVTFAQHATDRDILVIGEKREEK